MSTLSRAIAALCAAPCVIMLAWACSFRVRVCAEEGIHVAEAPSSVHVDFDVPVAMRDGTILRANVFRPDDGGAGRYPVLVTRTPYGKDLPIGTSGFDSSQIARLGFIVVVQDVRGCFASDGEWFPFLHEGPDGVDTAAWAARLPGSTGAVGTYGMSYMGFTQWSAVRDGADHVRAMAPAITWDTGQDGSLLRNGVVELGLVGSWTMLTSFDKAIKRHRGDPQALGRAIYGIAREYDQLPTGGYAELPLSAFGPLARVGLEAPLTMAVQLRDDPEYLAPANITPAYSRARNLPALHIGGWHDIFLNGTIQNFNAMRAAGQPGQYLLIGPWSHGMFDGVVGEVNFGMAASGAMVNYQGDLLTLHMQFFRHYLQGVASGVEQWPPVRYFVMGANQWRASATWPPAGAEPTPWYLHSGGGANSLAGDGAISPEKPGEESADTYTYDPQNPVPTVGGATLLHRLYRAGPYDQREVEARHDVLVYTSAPLAEPVEVTGHVAVTLYVASDAPDTDFVARLVDVTPEGQALPLTDGITRMRYRAGVADPQPPLEEGQVYQIELDLWATSNVFLPGHRIRLDVTSSNFPRWERNLNTGDQEGTAFRPARQRVLHDAGHPSHVLLPLMRPGAASV